jgi:hypothetical protein
MKMQLFGNSEQLPPTVRPITTTTTICKQSLRLDSRSTPRGRWVFAVLEARIYADSEFEKYRVIQDRLFSSDFDRFLAETNPLNLDSDGENNW